jgi:hypothetical protein
MNRNKKVQRTNKTENCFFEKINKIDKPLANLSKIRREKPISVKSEMQSGDNNKHHRNTGNNQRLF